MNNTRTCFVTVILFAMAMSHGCASEVETGATAHAVDPNDLCLGILETSSLDSRAEDPAHVCNFSRIGELSTYGIEQLSGAIGGEVLARTTMPVETVTLLAASGGLTYDPITGTGLHGAGLEIQVSARIDGGRSAVFAVYVVTDQGYFVAQEFFIEEAY